MTDTDFECPECEYALNMLTDARAERARTEAIRAEIAAMLEEARQLCARTIELNQRAALDLAPTTIAN